jgi:hypothetical protein
MPGRADFNWPKKRETAEKDGGAEGVRTPDLLNAIQEYLPTCMALCEE